MGVNLPQAIPDARAFGEAVAAQNMELEDAALSAAFRTGHPGGFFLYRHLNLFNPFVNRGKGSPMPASERAKRLFAPDYILAPEELAAVACPTLLIGGAEDRLVAHDFSI